MALNNSDAVKVFESYMITLWDAGWHGRVLSVKHNDGEEIKLSFMVVSRALHPENCNINVGQFINNFNDKGGSFHSRRNKLQILVLNQSSGV